jgi:hypothetical protein
LLYTNPPGVSLNRLELKKQMRYLFCAKTFCVLQKNVLGEIFSLSGREWPTRPCCAHEVVQHVIAQKAVAFPAMRSC